MNIEYEKGTFYLRTKSTTYIMDIYKGYLRHLYYGEKIAPNNYADFMLNHRVGYFISACDNLKEGASLDIIPQEMGLNGVGDFRDEGIHLTTSNGINSVDLKYSEFKIHEQKINPQGLPYARGNETLEIILKDTALNITVKLFYSPLYEEDVIVRRTEIVNQTGSPVSVEKIDSFNMDIADTGYKLVSLNGKYGNEKEIVVEEITVGKKCFYSSKGNASSHNATPFICLSTNADDERSGNVIGAMLLYSGSFSVGVERGSNGDLRLSGGMGYNDFKWILNDGEKLTSPEIILTFSNAGLGAMSRNFHNAIRNRIISPEFVFKDRPIVANTWESCLMNFNENTLKDFILNASKSGADTIVLDDGWFKGRNDDSTSLGDWVVDSNKLPNGLKPVIDYAKNLGMNFGLWFEPEMISEKSDLYKAHKDWVIAIPERTPKLGRNQLVLDLSNKDVVEYIKNIFDYYLGNFDITYIKWDCNRYITDSFSAFLGANRQGELHHRYILGLYEILGYINSRYPKVLIEGCAGGGGRFDAGMLFYQPQIWASDVTCAEERAYIQYGASIAFPLSTVSAHISDIPNVHTQRNINLKTRANIASLGVFGLETSFNAVSNDFIADVKSFVDRYKKLSRIVLEGDLYRLSSPFNSRYLTALVIDKNKSNGFIVFYMNTTSLKNNQYRLYIDGLDENKTYSIPDLNIIADGKTLKCFGICMPMSFSDNESELFEIFAI